MGVPVTVTFNRDMFMNESDIIDNCQKSVEILSDEAIKRFFICIIPFSVKCNWIGRVIGAFLCVKTMKSIKMDVFPY